MDAFDSRVRELHDRIQAAVARDTGAGVTRLNVALDGSRATLKGDVRTWAEREAAERAALAMPGVSRVDNQLCLYVKGTVPSS